MRLKYVTLILVLISVIFISGCVTQYTSLEQCNLDCIEKGYDTGECLWPNEAERGISLGECLIEKSRHCGNQGQCNCYCYRNLVCCEIYGLGSYMRKVNIHYEWTTREECKIPEGFVGGGREIVDDKYCSVGSKECVDDSDCVVFGTDGDCNCGCFNKDFEWESGGECFCLAPTSCECVDGKCEGIFE